MPVILLICVFATIGIAIHANRVAAEQAISDADKNESSRPSSFEVTQAALMQDAYPEINSLISDYFDAYVSGNVAKLNSGLYRTLDEIETVTLEERAKYIQSVRNLTVYTKPGPVEDSWVAYAYTDVRYMGCEEDLPGMVAFYICKDEDGTYYINADETTQSVKDYITAVNLQDDVVELYNRVNVEYADKLKEDQMFAELVAAIYAEIDESIGERLTGADAAVAAAEAANAEAGNAGGEGNGTAAGEDDTPKEVKIRATTTVRVRKSDSTESEVLGKAEAGEEFVRISEQGNGWSKISFAGGAAFVKSEFFEVLDAEPAGIPVNTGANAATTATTAAAEATTQAAAASASTNAGTGASNAATGASTAAGTGSTVAASGNASTGKSASSANASTG
ncbi:MAG: SH3 domain-containing protein, partial [Lachnospiraceae bacterium]|nr:SH3 domain-containing protein [Lachnospiraceae bacterium]